MSDTWDPRRYAQFADERGRPFLDLLARVGAVEPADVVDLGCGPGTLTALLAERWPTADVLGVDSSPAMIAAATPAPGLRFEVGDVRAWSGSADVLVSNATLQWVPGHLDLLSRLVGSLRPGGWLAVQVPGNFEAPSHTIRGSLESEAPYAAQVGDLDGPASHGPIDYLRALQPLAGTIDAWETTYLHVLHGPDPVFAWIAATSARLTLAALDDDLRPRFEAELKQRLAAAYPDDGDGVVLPFRRVFVVAQR